jgi:hypothetical protein
MQLLLLEVEVVELDPTMEARQHTQRGLTEELEEETPSTELQLQELVHRLRVITAAQEMAQQQHPITQVVVVVVLVKMETRMVARLEAMDCFHQLQALL